MSMVERDVLKAKSTCLAAKVKLANAEDRPGLQATLESFEYDALVEIAAPGVLEQLQTIRERRESGLLELTPALVVRLDKLSLAARQLLALAGSE